MIPSFDYRKPYEDYNFFHVTIFEILNSKNALLLSISCAMYGFKLKCISFGRYFSYKIGSSLLLINFQYDMILYTVTIMCQNTTSHKTYTLIQCALNCIWPIDDRASTKTRAIWFSKSPHEIYMRTHSSNILVCILSTRCFNW